MTDRNTIRDMLDERNEDQTEEIRAFEKKIKRGLNWNIYKRSILVILAAVLLFMLTDRLYHYEQEKTSWHLADLEQVIDGDNTNNSADDNAFIYIKAYYDLFAPGYTVEKRTYPTFANRLVYGEYEFSLSVINTFRIDPEGGFGYSSKDSSIRMINGRIVQSEDIAERLIHDSFTAWWSMGSEQYEAFYRIPDPVAEVEQLSASAYVEMDVELNEKLSVEDVLKLQAEYPDSRILYAVTFKDTGLVQNDSILMNTCGFSMMDNGFNAVISKEAWEKYPNLAKNSELGYNMFSGSVSWYESLKNESIWKQYAQMYMQHYQSILKLLLNNKVLRFPENTIADNALAEAEENGVSVIGLRLSLTKEDALRFMTDSNVKAFHIADIKMSRFDN